MAEGLRAYQTGEALKPRDTKETLEGLSVVGLNCYVIKSCGVTTLTTAQIGPRGIVHDREFMVVDAEGKFRTQREDKKLALVRPSLEGETLRLKAPGMQELSVSVTKEGQIRRSIIWRDTTDGVDQGDLVAEWFSDLLQKDSRVVRMPDGYIRQVDQKYALSENDQVGFADGYPFLLTSVQSLEELDRRIVEAHPEEEPIPMNRFRPNIVVSGLDHPFEEDAWREIIIGKVAFLVAKPCARCPIPQTDQETAARGKEPQRTLLSFRPKNGEGFPYFGQNLIHRNTGTISVWDTVTALVA